MAKGEEERRERAEQRSLDRRGKIPSRAFFTLLAIHRHTSRPEHNLGRGDQAKGCQVFEAGQSVTAPVGVAV